jgi:hypothetical protein
MVPELWSQQILKTYRDELKIRGMTLGPSTAPCPLSKALFMESLMELIKLQPDKHIFQILAKVPFEAEIITSLSDHDAAKRINELVCSARSACKNDSSCGSQPAGSTVRIRRRQTAP